MSILSTWPDGSDPFRERSDAHSGLNFAYGAGRVRDDNTVTDTAAGTVALTDAITNYVEATSAGVVSANTSGFTADRIPLFTVVTSGGAIGTVTDKRALLGSSVSATHTHTESDVTDLSHYTTTDANTDIDARVTKAFVDALNVDADTLDGSDSTAFATAGHTHNDSNVPAGFADLVVVEAGSQASVTDSGGSIDITWRWGITGTTPYFNSAGVTAGDEAALCIDPTDGTHVLVPVTV